LTFSAVVEVIGAVNWNTDTGLGHFAKSEARLESQAVSASVVGCTTGRNIDAFLLSDTPSLIGISTRAVSTQIVIVGAFCRDFGTPVGDITPGKARQQGQTVTAQVTEITTNRNINTIAGLRAERLSSLAELDARV